MTLSREVDRLLSDDSHNTPRPPSRSFSAKISDDGVTLIDFDPGFFDADQVQTYIETIIEKNKASETIDGYTFLSLILMTSFFIYEDVMCCYKVRKKGKETNSRYITP